MLAHSPHKPLSPCRHISPYLSIYLHLSLSLPISPHLTASLPTSPHLSASLRRRPLSPLRRRALRHRSRTRSARPAPGGRHRRRFVAAAVSVNSVSSHPPSVNRHRRRFVACHCARMPATAGQCNRRPRLRRNLFRTLAGAFPEPSRSLLLGALAFDAVLPGLLFAATQQQSNEGVFNRLGALIRLALCRDEGGVCARLQHARPRRRRLLRLAASRGRLCVPRVASC